MMIWSPVTDDVKWRRVICKLNDPSLPKSLSLSLGDWVYVDQISKADDKSDSTQWYYGFKCGASRICGIFPVACTEKPSDFEDPELYAEIMSFLPMAQQLFSVGDRRIFLKASVYLQEMAICQSKSNLSFSTSESKLHNCDVLEFLSLCERYIGFPLQMRIPNPLSFVSVHLYDKYLQSENVSKERERPKRDLFNISVHFDRCPSAAVTLYLASQSIRLPESNSVGNGSDQDNHLINLPNHLIEFLRGNDDGIALGSVSPANLHFSDFCRISENVTIDGFRSDYKTSVIFSELKPFNPSDTRILLVIMVDKVGSSVTKRGRNVSTDVRLPVGDCDKLRRPVAVGCVDITKDVLPTVLPFHTPFRSFDRRSRNSFTSSTRVVSLRSSLESSHADILAKLANETRSSVWDLIPSTGVVKSTDQVTSNSVLPPSYPSSQSTNSGGEISDELEIEIKDIKMVDLQSYHLIKRFYPGSLISRPYGIIEGNFSTTETIRNDFFVTLKSAVFDKTSSRKEYNVEVEISLRDPQGRPFPWIEGAGETPYVSSISASRSQPRWNELIRIAIPWSMDYPSLTSPHDPFSRLANIMDSSSVTEDHIEPTVSSSSSQRSSGDSGIFSRKSPTSAHLRFVVRHRSIISVGFMRSGRLRWLRSPSPSFGREFMPLYDSGKQQRRKRAWLLSSLIAFTLLHGFISFSSVE
ncbi:unnamed protein product [Rodentolepis nana]|uniref:C2 DOCK-type domain-containing protein n=1 Tax=Rodentolepis nana TaxID=102285 RepID=A0A0R3TUK4_RODNA|nr:unnamed protein product [Rodentolepis nana]